MTDDQSLPAAVERTLEDADGIASLVETLGDVPAETRKSCLEAVESAVGRDPAALERASPLLAALLDDEDRSVRLVAAKTAAGLAADYPERAVALADPLTVALADDFYFVRGRAAQALGHVAQAEPDAVDRARILARLLNALSVDRPEIRQYVAGALARIALGNPAALRTLCDDCGPHLDDEDALVRYHLVTALAVVASAHPSYLTSALPAIQDRLTDDEPYVRGRAAETLGLVATATDAAAVEPVRDRITTLAGSDESFVTERAQFAAEAADGDADPPGGVGDPDTIAAATDDIVAELTSPDVDGGCPACSEPLPEARPPFCPACGAPIPQ